MKRRFTFLAIAAFMSMTVMAQPSQIDGKYQIATKADLEWLAEQVNNGTNFSGQQFVQTADIDLGGIQDSAGIWSGAQWTPIGNNSTQFSGTYDGNGFVISNLYYNNPAMDYVGLFGGINNATLKNITLASGFVYGYQYAGGICGISKGESKITCCANIATVYGKMERIGGILAQIDGTSTVNNCINYGIISAFNFTGGVIGGRNKNSVQTVSYCINVGQVFTMRCSGNLYGLNNSGGGKTDSCYYDNQINPSEGWTTNSKEIQKNIDALGKMEGKPTSQMIGNGLASLLDNNLWEFEDNMYPRLKISCNKDAVILAATPVLFNGDKADSVANDFTVSTNNNVMWKSSGVNETDPSISITGSNAKIMKSTGVILTAQINGNNNYIKRVYLRTEKNNATPMGTIDAPLPIENEADLIELQKAMKNYGTYKGCANYDGFKGLYFEQKNDIKLTSLWTEAIGVHNSFKGNYDGCGNSIMDINVDLMDDGIAIVGGLFNCASYGEIKNVSLLTKAKKGDEGVISGIQFVGGICGATFCEKLTNCIAVCKVDIGSSNSYAGGIVGVDKGYSIFSYCENKGDISGNTCIGGILGTSNIESTFIGCKNYGNISGKQNIAGICSDARKNNKFQYCENHDTITATSATSNSGGIIGTTSENGIIVNGCINTHLINGSSNNGGIIGNATGITITNCLNLGEIKGSTTGGIAGKASSTVSISNCFNAGKSSGNGIASNGTISNCINIGKAETKAIASTTEESITNCFYDNQMSSASDTYATSKGTSNMVGESLNLGADWVYTSGLYPMIKALENSKYMIVAATPVILKEGETVNGVSTKFTYGTDNYVEWSCNEPDYVSFINGTAYPANPGLNAVDVVITVSKDSTTFKKIAMKINKSTGTTTSISWVSDLGSIEYGEKIPESKFSATVNVNTPEHGNILYSVSKDSILHAGNYHITATFIPNEGSDYMPSSKSATLKVTKKTVDTLLWEPEKNTYTYGASDNKSKIESAVAEVNGVAVDGTFEYDIPALTVGEQTVKIIGFISTNYKLANNAVLTKTITVDPIAASISWATPASISYGTPLTSQQLSAFSPIEGTLVYKIGDEVVTATSGKILNGGSHTITATLTPTSPNYAEATKSVTITVDPILPTIVWENPADITFGTLLSDKQLNAKVDGVSGDFTYTPNFGERLKAEKNITLRVDFTPKGSDANNYKATYKEVKINVNKADAIIDWEYPANITYGTALSETQLNAAVHGVIGTFTYNHNLGDKLSAGKHELTVDFTPTGDDINNCNAASKTVILTVDKATPEITWNISENIIAGTALTEDEHLNAKANIGGSFVYKDGENTINADDVLSAGSHQLTAIFTPADTANYKSKSKTITISVKMNATITWSNPAPIVYGTALSATQLNATSNVEGTIIYKENDTEISIGTILSVGSHTITALLPETDSYNAATVQATIVVTSPEDETAIAETEVTFSVYPNPTADVFFVETDSNVENIFIYNAQGALVKVEPNTGKTRIDISDVETGTYFVKVGEKTIKLLKF